MGTANSTIILPVFLAFFLVVSITVGSDAVAADCQAQYQAIRAEALKLDYRAFDQTPDSGFRVLAAGGCPREAADLIEEYIEVNKAGQRSLVWHLAQMRGQAGQTEAAIAASRQSLDPDESEEAPFRWNAHVHAYLGILTGNRALFDSSLAQLEAGAALHAGNRINASFWQRLAPYFDLGYAGAQRRAYPGQAED